jgi:putative ABC transport system permease protein
VPPDTPGISASLAHAQRTGLVLGLPGRDLPARLDRAGVFVQSEADYGYYDFVNGLRVILWTVAAVVLGVGLLTLMLGGVDRALARRRELASLRVLGTSSSTLRRAQLLEAAIPAVAGSLLAIASGLLAGTTYLRMADAEGPVDVPWASVLWLLGVSALTALAVATVTVIATNPRLTPDLVRQE